MSILSDGLQYVAFQLHADSEARLNAPQAFLAAWNEAARSLAILSGWVPSSHPTLPRQRLVFVEVDGDLEVGDKVAVWSPLDGVIKINHAYIDRIARAANIKPLIAEFSEALGGATLAFQQKNSNLSQPEVIGWGEFTTAFRRVVGAYALTGTGIAVSSVWRPEGSPDEGTFIQQELLRCYRKLRLGYAGDDFLADPFEGDVDIAYGFLLELFTVFSDWSVLRRLLQTWVPAALKESGVFERGTRRRYEDLVSQLSELSDTNLETLLNTWGFWDTSILRNLPEGLNKPGDASPVTMSSRFAMTLEPAVLEREQRSAQAPNTVFGGADSFGIATHQGGVFVLKDPAPADGVSFKGLKATLLGTFEHSGPPREIPLGYNLGEKGDFPETVLVPMDLDSWEYRSSIELLPAPNQTLKLAKAVDLGLEKIPYRTKVTHYGPNGEATQLEVDIEWDAYVVYAEEEGHATYVRQGSNHVVQVLTVDRYPCNRYKDPNTGRLVDIPGGMVKAVRSNLTTMTLDYRVLREFRTMTLLVDQQGVTQGTLFEAQAPLADPFLVPVRERPASGGRGATNLLDAVPNPVLSEQLGMGSRLVMDLLAKGAGVTPRTGNFKTSEDLAKQTIQQLAAPQLVVVEVPESLVNTIKEVANWGGELRSNADWIKAGKELIEKAVNDLPAEIKGQLIALDPTLPVVLPRLRKDDVPGTITFGNPPKRYLVSDLILNAAKGNDLFKPVPSPSAQALERLNRVEQQRRAAQYLADGSVTAGGKTISMNQLRGILTGDVGMALGRPNKDPGNPLSYLDGTFTGAVLTTAWDSFIPNSQGHPAATAEVFSHVAGATVAALGLESACPGLANTVMQSVQQHSLEAMGLMKLGDGNAVPAAITEILRDIALGCTNQLLGSDPLLSKVATDVTNFLADRALEALKGSGAVHDVSDGFRIIYHEFPFQSLETKKNEWIFNGENDTSEDALVNTVNVVAGLASSYYDVLGADPKLQSVVNLNGWWGATIQQGAELRVVPNGASDKAVDAWWLDLAKVSNMGILGFSAGALGRRIYSADSKLEQLKLQQMSQASLEKLKSSLMVEFSASNALSRLDPELEKERNNLRNGLYAGAESQDATRNAFAAYLTKLDGSYFKRFGVARSWTDASGNGGLAQTGSGSAWQPVFNADPAGGTMTSLLKTLVIAQWAEEQYKLKDLGGALPTTNPFGESVKWPSQNSEERWAYLKTLSKDRGNIPFSLYTVYDTVMYPPQPRIYEASRAYRNNYNYFVLPATEANRQEYEDRLNAIAQEILNEGNKEDLTMFAKAEIREVVGGETYVFEVMPAVRSVAQTQGMQAPGAGQGIQLRSSLNIAKLAIPGSGPVYQVMGINEEFVEFVGCFFGWDFDPKKPPRTDSQFEEIPFGQTPHNNRGLANVGDSANDPNAQPLVYGVGRQFNRAYQESELVRKLQMRGKLLQLSILSYIGTKEPGKTRVNQEGIRIQVQGYITNLERFAQRDDRVWYRIQFRITGHNRDQSGLNQRWGSTVSLDEAERQARRVADAKTAAGAKPDTQKTVVKPNAVPVDTSWTKNSANGYYYKVTYNKDKKGTVVSETMHIRLDPKKNDVQTMTRKVDKLNTGSWSKPLPGATKTVKQNGKVVKQVWSVRSGKGAWQTVPTPKKRGK